MERNVRQSVCNDLRDRYEELDLESVFIREGPQGRELVPLARWEIKRKIRQRVLSDEEKYLIEGRTGHLPLEQTVYPEYHKEIDVSLNEFISDCLRFGILKESSRGKYELVRADPTAFESEREGIRIRCRWEGIYTVYRHRMNTSGEIDVKANGDPAIDGRTLQDPLAW